MHYALVIAFARRILEMYLETSNVIYFHFYKWFPPSFLDEMTDVLVTKHLFSLHFSLLCHCTFSLHNCHIVIKELPTQPRKSIFNPLKTPSQTFRNMCVIRMNHMSSDSRVKQNWIWFRNTCLYIKSAFLILIFAVKICTSCNFQKTLIENFILHFVKINYVLCKY